MGDRVLISSDENNEVIIRDISQKKIFNKINCQHFNESIISLVHPPTYLNKILIVGKKNIEIWNIVSNQKIYSFDKTLDKILDNFQ